MADINARIQRTVEEMTVNEALLGMVNWGITATKALISKSQDLDDPAALESDSAIHAFDRKLGGRQVCRPGRPCLVAG